MFSHDIIKKRILVFGANGMLGQRTAKYLLKNENVELLCSSFEKETSFPYPNYESTDFTKRDNIKNIILNFYPDVIINCAAFTNVDACETERELSWKINVKGVEYISEAARVIDSHIIHFSTDYIFNGSNGPYHENDKPDPISYYGRTKLASENVLKISGVNYTILRTNVLYGSITNGRLDFVRWVVNALKKNENIKIVTDQINNPTFIDDLVLAVEKIINHQKFGIYNIGGREFISRYDFTLRIADFFELDKKFVAKIVTTELNQAAKRPLKSGLITIKAESEFGFKPISFEDSFLQIKNELL